MRSIQKCSALTLMALAAAAVATPSFAHDDDSARCSVGRLRGAYAIKLDGIVQVVSVVPPLPERKINLIATVTFDGAGKFTANAVGRINGDLISTPFNGVYSVKTDCTGALDLTGIFRGFNNVQANFIAIEGGQELFLVVNSPAPPANPAIIQISGDAKRLRGRD